jgi:hypothetical protein
MKVTIVLVRDSSFEFAHATSGEVNLDGLEARDMQDAVKRLAKELEKKATDNRKQKDG